MNESDDVECTTSSSDTSVNSREFGFEKPSNSLGKRTARCHFTQNERQSMVQFIIDRRSFYELKGTRLWKQMSTKFPNHSWQSLKEHFRKKIYPLLHAYEMPPEALAHFRKGMSSQSKNRRGRRRYTGVQSSTLDKYATKNQIPNTLSQQTNQQAVEETTTSTWPANFIPEPIIFVEDEVSVSTKEHDSDSECQWSFDGLFWNGECNWPSADKLGIVPSGVLIPPSAANTKQTGSVSTVEVGNLQAPNIESEPAVCTIGTIGTLGTMGYTHKSANETQSFGFLKDSSLDSSDAVQNKPKSVSLAVESREHRDAEGVSVQLRTKVKTCDVSVQTEPILLLPHSLSMEFLMTFKNQLIPLSQDVCSSIGNGSLRQ